VSELPPGWLETSVGNVASDVAYGFTASADRDRVGPHMLRITDIQDNKVNWSTVPYCKIPDGQKTHYLLRPADILFARTGATVGKSFRITGQIPESVFASYLIRVRCDLDDLSRYLAYYFQSPGYWEQVTASSAGTGQPNVNGTKLKELKFPLAPAPQQLAIADKLDNIVEKISSCRARINRVPQILKRFREAVLEAAVSGRLTEEWRNANEIRDERVATDIQSISRVGTGSTPLRSHSHFYSANGTAWITSAATSQPLVSHAEEFVTEAAIKAHRLKVFPAGTLLVAMYGEGKTRGQVTELAIEATINQACAAIVVDESKATKGFIKLVLKANYMQMRALAEGGNQPNLNLSKIKAFPLQLPPVEEQREVVRCVAELFCLADKLNRRYGDTVSRIENLTPSVLAKAFRGELVPQDPNDEPAGEMLKRVRKSQHISGRDGKVSGAKHQRRANRI
jgi:type I restriction enzyme S subunit